MSKNKLYIPFNNFVVRTPLFPYTDIKDKIRIIKSREFQEALFLASPDLFNNQENDKNEKKEKSETSLQKYFFRSCTRCTPFGLFAGCSTGTIGDESVIELAPTDKYSRCTRLDMQYLCALIQYIENDRTIRNQLLYYPNDSIYEIGGKLRYVEYHYKKTNRIHEVSSVELSEYLSLILDRASTGAKIETLAEIITDEEITKEEAIEFIEEMIDSQLLKSELNPSVVGDDVLTVLIEKLSRKDNIPVLPKLCDIKELLLRIDSESIGTTLHLYETIIGIIKSIGIEYEAKYLFQADMVKPAIKAHLSHGIIDDINSALLFLAKINKPYKNQHLEAFKEAFSARYEQEEIPLAFALDRELGIGYPKSAGSGDLNVLIDNLVVPSGAQPANQDVFSQVDVILLKKYIDAVKTGEAVINLNDSDFKGDIGNVFPSTISVMCSIISDSHDKKKILLKSAGGICGGNLIGRFCHTDDKIMTLAKDIAGHEKNNAPDVIYAELSHLPESRIGNIASRPMFRDYVLHYLSNSDEEPCKRIDISDLMLSVRNNKLCLRSKKFNKIIIPRLTCAHNHSLSPIPIYRFLCDLQSQDSGRSFQLPLGGIFSYFEYMPRIEYGNVILSRQKWMIKKEEIEGCYNMKDAELLVFMQEFVAKRNIVRYVVIPESDNEMYIDLNDIDCLKMMLSLVAKRPAFSVEEFLFDDNDLLVRNGDSAFTNEVILFFHR